MREVGNVRVGEEDIKYDAINFCEILRFHGKAYQF
jgi:hypothetical protein